MWEVTHQARASPTISPRGNLSKERGTRARKGKAARRARAREPRATRSLPSDFLTQREAGRCGVVVFGLTFVGAFGIA